MAGFPLAAGANGVPDADVVERMTELVVIVSLMGAGLKIDRTIGWASWRTTRRLLVLAMPLTIAGVAVLGWWVAGPAPAAALLPGAVLAPTDPLLAGDVQVGPPGGEAEDEVRLGLTSEAGLNDGLAFPFTNAAIAMAVAGSAGMGSWLGGWVFSTSRIDETSTRAETYVDITRGRRANHLYLTRADDPLDGEHLPRTPPDPLDEGITARLANSIGEQTAWEVLNEHDRRRPRTASRAIEL